MKKIIILFLLILYSSASHADTKADLNKIDGMFKKGYITKSECIDLKSNVMGGELPKTVCDDVKKTIEKPKLQISSQINKLFSGNTLFIIITSLILFIFYLKRSNLSDLFISFFKGPNKNLKKNEKSLFSFFQLRKKSLIVPALFVIIAILSFDKFSNFIFNDSKDEYKNVNFNSLKEEEKRAYTCVMTYGFKKGSSDFKNCVFKIAQAELELKRLDQERKIADEQIKVAKEANKQAKLQALRQEKLVLEQRRSERIQRSSDVLLSLSNSLLNPKQKKIIKTRCRMVGFTWTCNTQ